MAELECFCYAVGHDKEGVCLSLSIGPYSILLDCGISDPALIVSQPLPKPSGRSHQVDAVICTHAHADHAKGLQTLQQHYPDIPIYASSVTSRLLPIQWLGGDRFPDCIAIDWRSPTEICPGLVLQFWPAGHLPGATCVLLTYDGSPRRQTVFYTGDCMVSSSRLVDGMPLTELSGLKPDVLIVDGSYGTARSSRRKEQENQLADVILRAIAQGQSVILPTPRLGLAQELLMLFRSHHHFTGQDVDIWVGPSIAAGCDAYLDLLPHFPSAVQNFARHQSLFWDDRIRPHVYPLESETTKTIQAIAHNKPSIFLVEDTTPVAAYLSKVQFSKEHPTSVPSSTEQPANHHPHDQIPLKHSPEPQPRWLLLLPQHPDRDAYQAFISQLRSIPDLHDQVSQGTVQPFSYSLGDHCDGPVLMQLIHSIRPQHLILVHGSPHFLLDLASQEELQTRYQIHLPTAGTRIELPVGDRFIQPDPPALQYQGELTALQTTVLLTLDPTIQDDIRWAQFSDTGLIEAQWQGNDLLLKGVAAPDVLRGLRRDSPFPINSCEYCQHYRDQHCWNKDSSLFGFRVTPEGSCPVFEPA